MLGGMSGISLVTRADDLGSFSGVAPAAIDAHRRGITRNVSVMAPTAWFADAAAQLRRVPSLCIGVHLTVCCEWRGQRWRPLSPPERVPSLVDADGRFKADGGAIHRDGARLSEVFAECQAQLDLARAHGLDVRYVDTHMGWEWIHEPSGPPRAADLMPAWCARNRVIWHNGQRPRPLPQPAVPASSAAARLLAGLDVAAPGVYLQVTHPCLPGHAIASERLGEGGVEAERRADYELIADRGLARELARRGVALRRIDEL